MSPTARTLEWLRDHSIQAQVVERRVPHSNTTIDLFGCIDIVALPGDAILGIQTTDGSHHAARLSKALAEKRIVMWLICGGRFEVWSWRKSARTDRWVRRVAKACLKGGPAPLGVTFIEEEDAENNQWPMGEPLDKISERRK